jgi:cytochrome b6-f complex iron-sulfur subunit
MNNENQAEKMNRLEFLKKMGLSGASLMAVYCGVTMSSCKNEDNTTPATTTKTATYDITTVKSGALKTVGGFYVDDANSIVIANTKSKGYVAVTLVCTHEGQRKVGYSTDKFLCTAHGATFDDSGKNLSVAPSPLKTYTVTQAGNILTVTL